MKSICSVATGVGAAGRPTSTRGYRVTGPPGLHRPRPGCSDWFSGVARSAWKSPPKAYQK